MPLTIHNTLTGNKEVFEPKDPKLARIYVCGPTVYDYAHIGHARCYVVYDVLVRHLRASGIAVDYVRNITDVDDKIVRRAKEAGEPPLELAARYNAAYQEDMAALGNVVPDTQPRVSDHIGDIIALIQKLIDNGAAYGAEGDVYFSVQACSDYGKLSHRKRDQLEFGASGRTSEREQQRKRHPADFALWKRSAPDELGWPSPFGHGRPGWHIECSAMSMKYLGASFDLHGGGLDLVFPHHENEIAQSECATGECYARYWMHNGFVEVDKEKMSKSLGNFFTAREVFRHVEPEAVRYLMLTMHYRAPLNMDWALDEQGQVTGFPQLEEAEHRVAYLYETQARLHSISPKRIDASAREVASEIADFKQALANALNDDLNMPIALARTAEFLKAVNELCDKTKSKGIKVSQRAVGLAGEGFDALAHQLGIGAGKTSEVLNSIRERRTRRRGLEKATIEARIAARTAARQHKRFDEADAIRGELAKLGVELLDSAEGTDWRIS